ncbi:hypothetical protein [Streptomyces avermitilis]|uniref:hypothetical protein n=1 Tax=Streptomyces avermitilis TaxID=33903 RepID=UPI003718D3E1
MPLPAPQSPSPWGGAGAVNPPWHYLVVNIGHPGADPWFPRLPRVPVEDAVAYA